MNIKDSCRICLRMSNTLYGLFDSITPDVKSTSSSVFAVWKTFVKILKNHDATLELSDRICQNCRKEILGAYSFAEKCESAKGICKQINKQVKVKLKKLKYIPAKYELAKSYRYSPVKKQKNKTLQIPLEEVQWAYNDRSTIREEDDATSPKENVVQMNEVPASEPTKEAKEIDLNGRSSYKCNVCDRTFAMKISYHRHVKTHSNRNGSVECPICKATFSSHSVFEVHSFMHSISKRKPLGRAKNFDCSQCPRKFAGQKALDGHERSHRCGAKKKGKAMFSYHCRKCDKVFASAKALSGHESRHEKHKCNLCSKLFGRRYQLINHLASHKMMNPFECNMCDKAFAEKARLDEHLKSHKEKSYLCPTCGKHFQNKQKYVQHMEEHNKPKADGDVNQMRNSFDMEFRKMHLFQVQNPYACEVCDARFPKHIELIRHRQVHSNDASHVCEVCNEKFHLAYALKLHMRIHEKQYDCGLCGESFADNAALGDHVQLHRNAASSKASDKPEGVANDSENSSQSIFRITVNSIPTNVELSTVEPVK